MTKQFFQPLPDNLEPVGTRCVKIYVPDDIGWLRNFWGVLTILTYWYNFERDSARNGRVVAQRWRNLLMLAQRDFWAGYDCDLPPELQIQEWSDEMTVCESLRWHNGTLQGFCCGEWVDIESDGTGPIPGGQTQPSTGSRPVPGADKCYSRFLDAGNIFLLPFGVKNGDTVTVTELNGAWTSDGVRWTCTDGTPFALGLCSGSKYHDGADPDATLFHGQLMLQVGDQYISATDGPVVLSGLAGLQGLSVLGNFETEALAGGTISFKICVTNNDAPAPSDFCYVLMPGNWDSFITPEDCGTPGCPATLDGSGIHGCCETPADETGAYVTIDLGATPVDIVQVKVTYDMVKTRNNGLQDQVVLHETGGCGSVLGAWDISDTNGHFTGTAVFNVPMLAITTFGVSGFARENTCDDGSYFTITQIEISGSGDNPFGGTNC